MKQKRKQARSDKTRPTIPRDLNSLKASVEDLSPLPAARSLQSHVLMRLQMPDVESRLKKVDIAAQLRVAREKLRYEGINLWRIPEIQLFYFGLVSAGVPIDRDMANKLGSFFLNVRGLDSHPETDDLKTRATKLLAFVLNPPVNAERLGAFGMGTILSDIDIHWSMSASFSTIQDVINEMGPVWDKLGSEAKNALISHFLWSARFQLPRTLSTILRSRIENTPEWNSLGDVEQARVLCACGQLDNNTRFRSRVDSFFVGVVKATTLGIPFDYADEDSGVIDTISKSYLPRLIKSYLAAKAEGDEKRAEDLRSIIDSFIRMDIDELTKYGMIYFKLMWDADSNQ